MLNQYSYTYKQGRELSDKEIYQIQVAREEELDNETRCQGCGELNPSNISERGFCGVCEGKHCKSCGGLCPSGTREETGLCGDCEWEQLKKNGQYKCSFCVASDIFPPAIGDKATGVYKKDTWELNRKLEHYQPTIVFNGYVCDMHTVDVDWVTLKWK